MVSKASDDLPEPDSPVMTTNWSRGRSTSIFLRLWTRAPRTAIQSWAIPYSREISRFPKLPFYHQDVPTPSTVLHESGDADSSASSGMDDATFRSSKRRHQWRML